MRQRHWPLQAQAQHRHMQPSSSANSDHRSSTEQPAYDLGIVGSEGSEDRRANMKAGTSHRNHLLLWFDATVSATDPHISTNGQQLGCAAGMVCSIVPGQGNDNSSRGRADLHISGEECGCSLNELRELVNLSAEICIPPNKLRHPFRCLFALWQTQLDLQNSMWEAGHLSSAPRLLLFISAPGPLAAMWLTWLTMGSNVGSPPSAYGWLIRMFMLQRTGRWTAT